MENYGAHATRTYQRRFGSWSEAVEAAGFEPRHKGENYAERPDKCPLCGSEVSGIDFHHWRYGENELGCYLCRGCHDEIHRGEASPDYVNWLVNCMGNLVEEHMRHHGTDYSVDVILERYNLPNVDDLVENAIECES